MTLTTGLHDRLTFRRGTAPAIVVGAAVVAAYVVAAFLGFRFASVAEQVTTVWPPTGISLAALLLWGPRLWPAVWVGALIANAAMNAPIWTAAVVATGNTLEAVVATWVLRRSFQFDARLQRVRDVLTFILVAAAGSTIISATVGVGTLAVSGVQLWQRFPQLWWEWWVGDAVGAIVVAPVILAVAHHRGLSLRSQLEGVLLVAGAAITMHIVFGRVSGTTASHHPLEYLIFPFVIAAALRGGQTVTSLVVLGASAVTIWNTVRGRGPFAGAGIHDSLLLLQVFTGVLASTGLLLAAAISERETGERRRAAAFAVGEVLARAPDLHAAAPAVLAGICGNLDWQAGGLWLSDPGDQRLRCIAQWKAPAMVAPAFERMTGDARFPPGVDLPGRVFATGAVAWIDNVVDDTNFPRAEAAREVGLHAAFGFPIRLGGEVLGVIDCFNRTVVPRDEDLLRTMSTVGHQVGQFVARKREEQAVTVARQQAEAANRAKDDFLATLSHELRTPLNAIVGWTRMMMDGMLDADGSRRALEVIDRNAQLQTQLVADLLDVSRIVAGRLNLDPSPVTLGPVIEAALDAVRPAAEARRVRLVARLTAADVVLEGDGQRLQQIVWNLVSNAVKFSNPGGTVVVELQHVGPASVRLRVSDDGEGIELEFLAQVFERFSQADLSVSRRHGGLGLGLAIVRHLVELHGGTIVAESEGPGRGAVFTVDLPAGTRPREEAPPTGSTET
jgi:signal transduction histidine kinase/integral membrane sensor domain MASE1